MGAAARAKCKDNWVCSKFCSSVLSEEEDQDPSQESLSHSVRVSGREGSEAEVWCQSAVRGEMEGSKQGQRKGDKWTGTARGMA